MKTRDAKSQSCNDLDQFSAVAELFEDEPLDLIEKIEAFGKYASRQSIAKFLTKYEIFKQILNVNGSIVECGVLHGAGLLTWAKLSSIFEPANHPRKVVGFDTFTGFPSVNKKDRNGTFQELRRGGLQGTPYEYVQRATFAIPRNDMSKRIRTWSYRFFISTSIFTNQPAKRWKFLSRGCRKVRSLHSTS